MFPPKGGVSKKYIPREKLRAKPLDYILFCIMSYGSYGQSIHETNPTNTTMTRAIGVIYPQ